MLKAHSRLFEHLALALDLALIAGCWLVAYVVRFELIGGTDVPPFRDYALQLLPILLVWGFLFHSFDLYRPSRLGSYAREWWDVAKACTLGVLVLVAVMTFAFHSYEYSRLVIGIFWVLSIAVVSFARAMFREALRVARRRGYNQRYAVVVGGGEPAAELLRVLRRRPDTGIQIVGLLSDKRDVAPGVTWLGGMDEIHRVLTTRSIDLVFIALPHADYPRLTTVLTDIGDEPVTIHLVPDVFALRSLSGGVEELDSVPFISLRDTSPRYGWNLLLKRVIDLAIGGIALALAAPAMALIALSIRLTSGGPVLYRQERMGLDGRRFGMLKFRTMRADAEAATGPVWARPDDPRRTRLGAFLRRFSLDELPQLWNVLRGEMSLVGPRPERPSFVEAFRKQVPGYMLRHKVKGGITGWAQIHGWRGNTSIEERIKCDLYYIEHWSIGLDVQILLKTLWLGFHNRNAY